MRFFTAPGVIRFVNLRRTECAVEHYKFVYSLRSYKFGPKSATVPVFKKTTALGPIVDWFFIGSNPHKLTLCL